MGAQQVTTHPRWDAFKHSLKQSNYITDFWNWLMTLMSKAAELVLFGSVLYSGYQMLPGISHAPAGVDAFVFVIQQAALDIGGMGLLKLAKRAGLPRESFPVRVGVTLVVLMILNVILASVKQALPMIPAEIFLAVETLLLVARAIMAVLFGHAIHALREEYGDSHITAQEAVEVVHQMNTLINQCQLQFDQLQSTLPELVHQAVSSLTDEQATPIRKMIHQEVYSVVHELPEQMKTLVHQAVHEQVHPLVQALTCGPAEMYTPNQEAHAVVQGMAGEEKFISQSSGSRSRNVSLKLVHGSAVYPPGSREILPACTPQHTLPDTPAIDPVKVRVTRYINEQLSLGRTPSLSEIEDRCQCARRTAIRYRREVLGEEEAATGTQGE